MGLKRKDLEEFVRLRHRIELDTHAAINLISAIDTNMNALIKIGKKIDKDLGEHVGGLAFETAMEEWVLTRASSDVYTHDEEYRFRFSILPVDKIRFDGE